MCHGMYFSCEEDTDTAVETSQERVIPVLIRYTVHYVVGTVPGIRVYSYHGNHGTWYTVPGTRTVPYQVNSSFLYHVNSCTMVCRAWHSSSTQNADDLQSNRALRGVGYHCRRLHISSETSCAMCAAWQRAASGSYEHSCGRTCDAQSHTGACLLCFHQISCAGRHG